MHSVMIKLDSIDLVKEFVRVITVFDSDFDLCSGRYTVDAKSILGIFSLDLTKPIQLVIYDQEEYDKIREALTPFIIQE